MSDDAFVAVLAYLESHPWLRDRHAGGNALRFNHMCACGLDVIEGAPPPENIIFTGETPEGVIEQARNGDRIAHEALCAVADQLTLRGNPLSPALQRYVVDSAKSPLKWTRARHPVSNIHRDEAIFNAVEIAVGNGLKVQQRHLSAGQKSACAIVAKALGDLSLSMSPENVATIWKGRREAKRRAGFKIASDAEN